MENIGGVVIGVMVGFMLLAIGAMLLYIAFRALGTGFRMVKRGRRDQRKFDAEMRELQSMSGRN